MFNEVLLKNVAACSVCCQYLVVMCSMLWLFCYCLYFVVTYIGCVVCVCCWQTRGEVKGETGTSTIAEIGLESLAKLNEELVLEENDRSGVDTGGVKYEEESVSSSPATGACASETVTWRSEGDEHIWGAVVSCCVRDGRWCTAISVVYFCVGGPRCIMCCSVSTTWRMCTVWRPFADDIIACRCVVKTGPGFVSISLDVTSSWEPRTALRRSLCRQMGQKQFAPLLEVVTKLTGLRS